MQLGNKTPLPSTGSVLDVLISPYTFKDPFSVFHQ